MLEAGLRRQEGSTFGEVTALMASCPTQPLRSPWRCGIAKPFMAAARGARIMLEETGEK